VSIRAFRQYKKLIRKTHRQGSSRRAATVLDAPELALRLNVAQADLEAELQRLNINYHKDALGGIWASLK